MSRVKKIRTAISLALLVAISFPGGAGATEFAKAKVYPVGTNPDFIATGDFNEDGKLDMAVANADSSNVSILLGNGDGTFQAAKNIAVSGGVGPIVVGDFNGDHKLDFVAGSGTNATLFLGIGDGTFGPPTQISVDASFLLAADFNQDGKLDLLTPGGLLLGNGDGTFQSPRNVGVEGAFQVADFNGDSKLDVLSRSGVYLGNGDGTFQPPRPLPGICGFPSSCGYVDFAPAADFNGDHKLDLAVTVASKCLFCTKATFSAAILFGKGDGTFQLPVYLGVGDEAITSGDFNGDGKPDIASAPTIFQGSGLVHVLLGKGDGTFPSIFTIDSGSGPNSIFAVDLNGDHLPDLVLTNPNDNTVTVMLNTSPTSGADLSVSVSASPEPVSVTQQLTYTVQAINSGPQDATNFTLKDTLPAGVTFVSSSISEGACSQASLVVTCNISKFASGDATTATLIVVPNSTGSVTNTATVSATEPDAIESNNSVTHSTRVDPMFKLSVTKSGAGSGTIIDSQGDLGNFNCGNVCTVSVPTGTPVGIIANPSAASVFGGWGQDCTQAGLAAECAFTMSSDQSITATFDIGPNFNISADASSLTVSPGSSVTTNISISPEGGPNGSSFNNPVALSCSVVGPAPTPSCSLSPNTLTPGSSPVNSILKISAPAETVALERVQTPRPMNTSSVAFLLLGAILFGLALASARTLPQIRILGLLCGFLFAVVFLQTGCGGGSGGQVMPQSKSYTVTVTAMSGSISKSVPVSLNVK
jgi:uncharacterized repeat protein (TIGR01451 family)